MLAYSHEKHLSRTVRLGDALPAGSRGKRADDYACCASVRRQGRVLDICPFVNIHVQARVLLFRPKVGAKLGACGCKGPPVAAAVEECKSVSTLPLLPPPDTQRGTDSPVRVCSGPCQPGGR